MPTFSLYNIRIYSISIIKFLAEKYKRLSGKVINIWGEDLNSLRREF